MKIPFLFNLFSSSYKSNVLSSDISLSIIIKNLEINTRLIN